MQVKSAHAWYLSILELGGASWLSHCEPVVFFIVLTVLSWRVIMKLHKQTVSFLCWDLFFFLIIPSFLMQQGTESVLTHLICSRLSLCFPSRTPLPFLVPSPGVRTVGHRLPPPAQAAPLLPLHLLCSVMRRTVDCHLCVVQWHQQQRAFALRVSQAQPLGAVPRVRGGITSLSQPSRVSCVSLEQLSGKPFYDNGWNRSSTCCLFPGIVQNFFGCYSCFRNASGLGIGAQCFQCV